LFVEQLEDRRVLSGFTTGPLVQVSGDSPLADCHDQFGDSPETLHLEVEPWLAVNPTNPDNLVSAWIQDQARGHVAGVSLDGGKTWESVVIPGLTICTGGDDYQVTDPWLTFGPTGVLYASGTTFNPDGTNALVVSKSIDGGLSWNEPVTVIAESNGARFNDKGSITADPDDPNLVYATWSRFSNSNQAPTWFSRSTDGGQSWEPARKIFDGQGSDVNFAHQILVLPDGTLANIFQRDVWTNDAGGIGHYDMEIAVLRSSDKGGTWEGPVKVADQLAKCDTRQRICFATDPDTGAFVRSGDMPDVAVDPHSGALYVVWEDARFGNFQYPSIAFSMSTDGGLTWSEPIQVNQTPTDLPPDNQQALHPSVHVNADGVVGVTYYDFRFNTLEEDGVPTDYWFAYADAGTDLTDPASWTNELRVTTRSFDLHDAFYLNQAGFRRGYFIGDYEGLASVGDDFLTLFIQPGKQEGDHGSVFFRRVRATGPAEATTATLLLQNAEVTSHATPAATPLPLGFDENEQTELTIRDSIMAAGDVDRFEIELSVGDVIGATVQAHGQLNPTVSLVQSDDTLLWFNDDHSSLGSSWFLPQESPLPKLNSNSTDSILQYVIDQPGTYFIDVAAVGGSVGEYVMDLVLARPGMESEPAGSTQILYLDFNGATVQSSRFIGGSGLKRLSPLRDFLPNWGLTAANEDMVIDVVLATVRENLSEDVRSSKVNGDYAESGTPGEFNIQMLNSRDNPEFDGLFGTHPYLSRVVVGGSTGELGLFTVAQAQGVDVGNFLFTDDAVVMLDWLGAPAGAHPASLNQYKVHPSSSKAEFVGTALGVLASHEASHNFGNWHTDQLSPSPNIMDTRPVRHLVPGGVFGHPSGPDLDFGLDTLADEATLEGQVNTLNVIAFGLSTGTLLAAPGSKDMQPLLAATSVHASSDDELPFASSGSNSVGAFVAKELSLASTPDDVQRVPSGSRWPLTEERPTSASEEDSALTAFLEEGLLSDSLLAELVGDLS
jgi:hypothetical protein